MKRVIGVEGDVITCCDDQGRISVNGQPLNEKEYAIRGGAACYGPMVTNCSGTGRPARSRRARSS